MNHKRYDDEANVNHSRSTDRDSYGQTTQGTSMIKTIVVGAVGTLVSALVAAWAKKLLEEKPLNVRVQEAKVRANDLKSAAVDRAQSFKSTAKDTVDAVASKAKSLISDKEAKFENKVEDSVDKFETKAENFESKLENKNDPFNGKPGL